MMIAIVLTGLVLTAAFATVSQSIRTVETARDYTRVAQILQSEMEDLRTLSWADLEAASTGGYEEIDLNSEFYAAFGDRYRAWRWIRDREISPGTTLSDQKEISIWVFWKDGNGMWRNKYAASWFTELGLHDYYYRSF